MHVTPDCLSGGYLGMDTVRGGRAQIVRGGVKIKELQLFCC